MIPNLPAKPKTKNMPSFCLSRIIDFLLWLTVPMLCIVPLVVAAYGVGRYYYQTYVYTAEDIAAVCDSLALPLDSSFCKGQGWQTTSQLRELLAQTYPPYATSLAELQMRFKSEFHCEQREGECTVNVPRYDVFLIIYHDGSTVTNYLVRDVRED
jgi:hypothetical protein